ncbi:HAD-IIA family hydrolase [Paenibacillus yanchengensis]|uniref:HAD-IIA family hydrolase n=1 Tax=Paenibacillus yanchengensis TaxID=2035833 RepID=A0ABW4YP93_9BACL
MKYDGFILDLEGTLIQSGKGLLGAAELVQNITSRNIPFRIITNTVGRSPAELALTLQRSGIEVSPELIITPMEVLNSYFMKYEDPISFLFVGPEFIQQRLNIQSSLSDELTPDYVILCDFERIPFGFKQLNEIYRYLDRGAKLITLSESPYYLDQEERKLDTGSFSKLFQYASGQQAILLGKPSYQIYKEALTQMGITSSHTLTVGDDINTDIRGGKEAGIKTVLVRSGKYRHGDELQVTPDIVVDNLLNLLNLINLK